MKTFKIKDLVVTLEGVPRTPQTPQLTPHFRCLNGCTFPVTRNCFFSPNSKIPIPDCLFGHTWPNACQLAGSLQITPIYTTNCGGTINCGGSLDPTIFQEGPINVFEELKAMKLQIAEYEKALEATLQPETKEDLEELESKLSAALHAVKEQKSKRGQS